LTSAVLLVMEIIAEKGEEEKTSERKGRKTGKESTVETSRSPDIKRKKKKVSSSEDKESGSKVETDTRTSLSCIKLQTIKVEMETEKLEKLKSLYKLQEEEEMQEDIGECLNIS